MEPIKCNCQIYYIMTNCKKTNIIPKYDKLTERLSAVLTFVTGSTASKRPYYTWKPASRFRDRGGLQQGRAERNYMSGNIRPRHFIFYFFMVPSGCHSNQSCLPGTSSNSGRPHLDPRRPPPPHPPPLPTDCSRLIVMSEAILHQTPS